MKCKDCFYCSEDHWCYVLNYLIHDVRGDKIIHNDIAYRNDGNLECEILPLLRD